MKNKIIYLIIKSCTKFCTTFFYLPIAYIRKNAYLCRVKRKAKGLEKKVEK